MTPAAVVRLALAALDIIPGLPLVVVRIADALDVLPDLIDELGDGAWTDEDVDALAGALAAVLDKAPGVPPRHAQRIAKGLASAVDLIVGEARGTAPVERKRARELLAKARANALPSPSTGAAKP